MRTSVAALMGISVLFVGVIAISESAQQADGSTQSQAANESYQVSVDVFTGIAQAGGQGIVWFGIAAIILVSLGLLVAANQAGGR